jgi:hypothetical protein
MNTATMQIVQGVRALYATSSSITAGDDTQALITANAVPTNLINAARTGMIDAWPGGVLKIIGDSDNNGFVITMTNVPQSACINLLMAVGGVNHDAGLFEADTATIAAGGVATASTITTAMTPAIAALPSQSGGTNAGQIGGCTAATNTVSFGFSLH